MVSSQKSIPSPFPRALRCPETAGAEKQAEGSSENSTETGRWELRFCPQEDAIRLLAQMEWLCKGGVRTRAWGAAWGFLTPPNTYTPDNAVPFIPKDRGWICDWQ